MRVTFRLCVTCSLGPAGAAVQFPAAPFPSPRGHVRDILPAFTVTRVGARLLIRSGTELLRVYPSRAGIPRRETGWREACRKHQAAAAYFLLHVHRCQWTCSCVGCVSEVPRLCPLAERAVLILLPRHHHGWETLEHDEAACYRPKLLTLESMLHGAITGSMFFFFIKWAFH